MSSTATIEPIKPTDIDNVVHHCVTIFHGLGMNDETTSKFAYHTTDWNISKKLVLYDKIIGFYLLHEGSIADWAEQRLAWADSRDCWMMYANCKVKEDLSPYRNRRGVEGIALGILPEYRGLGYGELLKDTPRHMGYDHIFGEHFKSSHNLHFWLKHRRLIAECDGLWVTLEDIDPTLAF